MRNRQNIRAIRVARRAMLFSFLLFLAVGWIVFDGLFRTGDRTFRTVEIPDLTGQFPDDVREGWMDLKIDYRYDADTPAGIILFQDPAAGCRRKLTEGSPLCRIRLTVSLGRETVTVPDVLGQDVRTASAALRALGLTVETEVSPGIRPEGEIYECDPPAGTILPKESRITLSVSSGAPCETVRVPDLTGLSRSEALMLLWLSQLGVGEVVETDAPATGTTSRQAVRPGGVLHQSHAPGMTVLAGTRISIEIRREEEE